MKAQQHAQVAAVVGTLYRPAALQLMEEWHQQETANRCRGEAQGSAVSTVVMALFWVGC
jgi:hypothetical protein